jgi:GAF domain-containing protein
MEKMAEYFRPDNWSLLLIDEERNDLYFALAVGPAAEALKKIRLKMGEGIAGYVAQHGENVIVPDVSKDVRFAKRVDEVTKWETRSIVCMPLRSERRTVGVVQLINANLAHFNDMEQFFLQSLCDYAAVAIENSRNIDKLQRPVAH